MGRGCVALFSQMLTPTGALNKWYKFNHTLPGRIIVYREGVGDGELQALVEYEVPQLLSSITASSPHSRYHASWLLMCLLHPQTSRQPSLCLSSGVHGFHLLREQQKWGVSCPEPGCHGEHGGKWGHRAWVEHSLCLHQATKPNIGCTHCQTCKSSQGRGGRVGQAHLGKSKGHFPTGKRDRRRGRNQLLHRAVRHISKSRSILTRPLCGRCPLLGGRCRGTGPCSCV